MKDIKEFAHYYIGQRCMNTWFPETHSNYNPGWILTGFDRDSHKPFKLETDVDFTWTNGIKLVLRRLEDMTEEELQSVYTLERDMQKNASSLDFDVSVRDHGFIVTRLDLLNVRLMVGYNGQIYKVIEESKTPTIEPANNQQLIFHYLLKQGFDLFGLIDAGLALDSKTLNQQA